MATKDRKQKLEEFLTRLKSKGINGATDSMQTIIPAYALDDPKDTDKRLRLLSKVVLFGTHDWYITRLDLPDETKVDWDGLHCRRHYLDMNGHVSHPDIDSVINDIQNCISAAIVAAIAAGFASGGAAASVAFKGALIACLKASGVKWIDQVDAWVTIAEERGDWHYCL